MHQDPFYGSGSHRHAHLAAGIAHLEKCTTILDYGSGKGTISNVLRERGNFEVREYDPGFPGKEATPEPADLVMCLDVMEHIEPECLTNVIKDLRRVTRKRLLLDISTKFTKNRWLSDGRNSHLIVEEGEWWLSKFEIEQFKLIKTWNTGVRAWVALLKPI